MYKTGIFSGVEKYPAIYICVYSEIEWRRNAGGRQEEGRRKRVGRHEKNFFKKNAKMFGR